MVGGREETAYNKEQGSMERLREGKQVMPFPNSRETRIPKRQSLEQEMLAAGPCKRWVAHVLKKKKIYSPKLFSKPFLGR